MNNLKDITVKFTADITDFVNKTKQVQSAVNNMSKSINNSTTSAKTTAAAKKTNDSLKKMADTTKATNQKINTSNKTMAQKFKDAMRKMADSSKKQSSNINKSLNKVKTSTNSLSKSFTSLARIGRFLVFSYVGRQLVNLTKNLIMAGANMSEIENLFVVSFGTMSDKANEFAQTIEKAWGVSATQTKQQTSFLNNMIKSMGLAEDQAYDIATSMYQLSYNIASLYDISQSDAMTKLRSGLVGISRPLLQLGINTKVATLQEVAYRRGITSTNRELTQQERVLATVWAVWEQTQTSWKSGTAIINGQEVAVGDMTKTIGTNANMLRVLKSRLGDVARYWGLAFQPVIQYVLPVIYKLIQGLIELGKQFSLFIGRMFGFETLNDIIGAFGTAGASSTDDLTAGLLDADDAASNLSDTISKMTTGIDELNILSEPATSGASLSAGGSIENDIGLPEWDTILEDALGSTIEDRVSAVKKAFKDLFDVPELKHFRDSIKNLYDQFKRFASISYDDLVWAWNNVIIPYAEWNVTEAFPTFVDMISASIEALSDTIEAFEPYGQWIFDNWLTLISKWAGDKFISDMEKITSSMERWSEIMKGFDTGESNWTDVLYESTLGQFELTGGGMIAFLQFAVHQFTLLGTGLVTVFNMIVNGIKKMFDDLKMYVITKFLTITGSIISIGMNIANGIIDMVEGLVNSLIGGINSLINAINSISFEVPDWVPKIGGKSLSIGLPNAPEVSLPRLYDGGVAYGDTLARVGDYTNSNVNPEVIAPLDKLSEIMGDGSSAETIALLTEQNALLRQLLNKDTTVNLDGREITRSVNRNNKKLGYDLGMQGI